MEFYTYIKPEHKSVLSEGVILTYEVSEEKEIEVVITRFDEDKMYFKGTNEEDQKYLEELLENRVEETREKEENE